MTETSPTPLLSTLRWLTAHAGFPATRLPDKAELLLLIATAAANEDRGNISRQSTIPGSHRNFNAEIRNYTAQRRRAHIKCDNSAKT